MGKYLVHWVSLTTISVIRSSFFWIFYSLKAGSSVAASMTMFTCVLYSLFLNVTRNEPIFLSIRWQPTTKKRPSLMLVLILYFSWPILCMHGDKSQPERDWVLNGNFSLLSFLVRIITL